MNDASSPAAVFQRGCQLLDLKRYADAEAAFRTVLAHEPQHDWALHQLAFALWRQDRETEALEVAMQAIGAAPDEAAHQVLRSHVLSSLHRQNEALAAADEAVRLDPAAADAFAARAQALSGQAQWVESELAARSALALNPEHGLAHHYLAHTLRQQGRVHENAAVVQEQLRRDPESPLAHANAGWAALERGARRTAEKHFAEALRLAPDFDWAREGLLQSFRARSPIYRAHLAYTFWMSKRRAGQQWAIILGIWLAVRFARILLTGPYRWIGLTLALGYLAFALWGWVARGVGNLLLLTDPFARMVLRRHEKLEAIFVGGGLLAGVAVATLGFAVANDRLLLAGGLWALAALPFACTFDNTRRFGRWLFGSIGTGAWLLALTEIAALYVPGRWVDAIAGSELSALTVVGLGCVLTTWIGNLGALRQRH